MAFLHALRRLFRGAETGEAQALVFYVRCDRCGEVIRVRADRRWDLVQELGEGSGGYSLHKDVLGTRCNALMHVLVHFDDTYRITHREVAGGQFVSAEAYDADRSGGAAPSSPP